MFFKCFVLLLSFILADNSVLGQRDDENKTIEDSYNDCIKWLRVPPAGPITLDQFQDYIGNTNREFSIVQDYMNNNPAANEKKDAIDFQLYGVLFKNICRVNDYTLKAYADYLKTIAAQKMLVEPEYEYFIVE